MSLSEIPKENWVDRLHSFVKAGLGSLPPINGTIPVGGFAAELFSIIVATPISKRTAQWMQRVAERMELIESQIGKDALLSMMHQEEFISFFLECNRIAVRCHQEEKLLMLQNSFTNYFFQPTVQFDKKYTFLQIVDELTTTHLSILNFVEYNEAYIIANVKGYPDLLKIYIENRNEIDQYFFRRCVLDLHGQGLIRLNKDFRDFVPTHGFATDSQSSSVKLLDLGVEFLMFVREVTIPNNG
ncbi:hypothetical protein [Siphonobacter sp.]|uniref:hypothetical protein n=1 Tax=Siphonobacter sp. TaxID=1869184 RepID=UPI003B3A65C1